MKVYLAGVNKEQLKQIEKPIYVLESFAYIHKHKDSIDLLLRNKFLLDSGAFTFIGKKKNQTINWDAYVNAYIEFINKYDINLFFELDIYSVIGHKETEQLRLNIEEKTNKKSIPVWHIFLGVDYFKKLCEEYQYIAIGASGKYDSKWTRTNPEKLLALVLYAKTKGVKVHGLGYTVLNKLHEIPFHSVDSTTWLNAGKYGELQMFDGRIIKKRQARTIGKVTIKEKAKEMLMYNFDEWIKFQEYADNKL